MELLSVYLIPISLESSTVLYTSAVVHIRNPEHVNYTKWRHACHRYYGASRCLSTELITIVRNMNLLNQELISIVQQLL